MMNFKTCCFLALDKSFLIKLLFSSDVFLEIYNIDPITLSIEIVFLDFAESFVIHNHYYFMM